MIIGQYIGAIIVAYVLGSIPVGLIVSKLGGGVDVREYGSGKTGATNVARTIGTRAGVVVLLGDGIKGALAVYLAWLIVGDGVFHIGGSELGYGLAQGLALPAAVMGHNWPVFTGFKGGRGMTTFAGGAMVLSWWVVLIGLALWGLVIYVSRYVSLGSIIACIYAMVIFILLASFGMESWPATLGIILGALLIIMAHRDNIGRLLRGEESKVGQKGLKRNNRPLEV